MGFKELYNQVVLYWPPSIDIRDGKIMGEGFISHELSRSWDVAESMANDDYEDLLVWVMFQQLHNIAKMKFRQDTTTVFITDLDKNSIEKSYLKALEGDL